MATIRILNPIRVMKVLWDLICQMSSWVGFDTHRTTVVWSLVPSTLVSFTCRTPGQSPHDK